MNPLWLARRLRRMTPGEAAKRVREQVRLAATIPRAALGRERWSRWAHGELAIAPLPAPGGPAPDHALIYDRSVALRTPMPWLDGTTDRPWPARHHALLSHHPGRPHGDVRPVWELHRLQFLPHLAHADPDRAISLLQDWLASNPYRMGPAWMSAMEVAIRWIAVHRTAAILGDDLPAALRRDLLGLARASADYLDLHPSTHSSAGNHLIVEALGMVWLAHAIRPRPQALLAAGRRILREQTLRQIRPDGTPIEQSLWYLGFVVDALQHWLLIEPEAVPEPVRERLAAALDLLHELTGPGGAFPDLGDRDDGRIHRDSLDYDESPFPGLLDVGARQLRRPEWRRRTEGAARRAAWFVDELGRRPRAPRVRKSLSIRTFAEGGWTSLRRGPARAVLDHGPLGMPPTFGHGHAGCLGLTLFHGETALLHDPGTGAYNADARLRDHFRSTAAHNTVSLGERDQAEALGRFLWRGGWTARLDETDDDGLTASCDAWVRRFGATHRRTVRWPAPDLLEVVDRFPGAGGVAATAHWHLGPDCADVELTPGGVRCDFGVVQLELGLPDGVAWTLHRGETDPMRGWWSPRYGAVEPATTIRVSGRVHGTTVWTTRMLLHDR